MLKEPVMNGEMLLKFFFTALCHNKTRSITLPMVEVSSVPDSFFQCLQVEYFPHEDKMKVSIRAKKETIVIPTVKDIQAINN